MIPGHEPTDEGTLTCPGMGGGHNWHATSYSPQTGMYYFNSGDGCQIYHGATQDFVEGEFYLGSAMENVTGEPREGSILAVDPGTGDRRWRFPLVSPPTSGLLSTGGGLLFAGTAEGYFIALDASSGKPALAPADRRAGAGSGDHLPLRGPPVRNDCSRFGDHRLRPAAVSCEKVFRRHLQSWAEGVH